MPVRLPDVGNLPVRLVAEAMVFARVVRLGGPPGWAQSAHRFSACERDRGMRRVLNVTALVAVFLLPPLSADVCMRAKCRALGGLLTSGV
ncbi:hypothetical protein Taro_010868 [Colocasia esculenta]|uniref:Uncharacterized protein n=1 Tax=Colocasia esculenta TaxID=4460 RepID=A0A843U494_COLES|nr:hypothetical protein [Colocasia esculenta]